ncbi:MAG: precorrin-6A reductase [Treponema sp.]|nr:precorrin-6A reductase [Treponema sp.]
MKILVFAGTTEGTEMVIKAIERGHLVYASVATEYGASLLQRSVSEKLPGKQPLFVRSGRIDEGGITAFLVDAKENCTAFDAVIDATHPFACEVSKNIRSASSALSVPYYRLRRTDFRPAESASPAVHEVASIDEACKAITRGLEDGSLPPEVRIFCATGSKELSPYTQIPRYQERVFVRVLPSGEAFSKCMAAGIPEEHVIAMQGVFSAELNEALFRQYGCSVLVTKQSGEYGGYPEKLRAAERLSMPVYVVTPPKEPATVPLYASPEAVLDAMQDNVFFSALTDVVSSAGDGQ